MSAPPAPNHITKALEAAMQRDPEARWSDTTIFAQAVWDALLAEGRIESEGLPAGNCIEGTFPLPYKVLIIDLEPRVYRTYHAGHDVTEPLMEGEAKPHA